jgi:hypothetical protein
MRTAAIVAVLYCVLGFALSRLFTSWLFVVAFRDVAR